MDLPIQNTVLPPITTIPATPGGVVAAGTPSGFDALGQGDFLRLLVTQLEQQDPFEPVDNKDMLAQMAQFSSLAGTTETNDTLQQILAKLDNLIAVQTAVQTGTQTSVGDTGSPVEPDVDPSAVTDPASTPSNQE